ncbi:hypothetical protein [Rhodococcus erythropolis]|uniref:hypothetical protein n=1 Tax=Rhodococcus erythropolis TaxID=1833 RepID=UPI000878D4D7|nr:hypothetical protein [Rhodococcus erythropolis]OFV78471.1 hypothetical protein RERY_09780 [Rhodococcus erythropolis]
MADPTAPPNLPVSIKKSPIHLRALPSTGLALLVSRSGVTMSLAEAVARDRHPVNATFAGVA